MPHPRKEPHRRRKAFGVSMPIEDVERMDALANITYPNGGEGKRSQFIVEALFLGLERRFGANWREIADGRRERQEVAA